MSIRLHAISAFQRREEPQQICLQMGRSIPEEANACGLVVKGLWNCYFINMWKIDFFFSGPLLRWRTNLEKEIKEKEMLTLKISEEVRILTKSMRK